jgi:protein PhnA
LRGASQILKGGTKAKSIRLVDGDHEISCKMDGSAVYLKASLVKKA